MAMRPFCIGIRLNFQDMLRAFRLTGSRPWRIDQGILWIAVAIPAGLWQVTVCRD